MYNTWDLGETNKKDVEVIWAKFQTLIEPMSNYRLNRFHLQQFWQLSSQTVDEFMTRCKTHARKCKFRDATETEERLIEQLVVGVWHGKVQDAQKSVVFLRRETSNLLPAGIFAARDFVYHMHYTYCPLLDIDLWTHDDVHILRT